MADAQTQGWDVVVELNEPALSRQLSQALNQEVMRRSGGMTTLPLGNVSGVSVVLNPLATGLSFVPGRPQDLTIRLALRLNGVDFLYQATCPFQALRVMNGGPEVELVVLSLEGAMLSFDNAANAPDLAARLADARVTRGQITDAEFLGSLAERLRTALREAAFARLGTLLAVLPLSGPVPTASFRIDARVVTEEMPPNRRAFILFTRAAATAGPPLSGTGPVHIVGPAADQTAIGVRNNFLLGAVLCPALNASRIFIPPPMFSFNPATGVCTSSTPTRIAGAPPMFLITGMTLTVNAAGLILLSGTFSLVTPVTWGGGAFTATVGLRWNSATQRVEPDGPPRVTVTFGVAWWVYLLSALLLAALAAAAGAAAGPVGAIIGAVVGAAVGITLVVTLQEITRLVIQGALDGALGSSLPPVSFPLPLLVPTALRTQSVRLDDLLLLASPEILNVAITGNLREIDRRPVEMPSALPGEPEPSGLSTSRYSVSCRGEFLAAGTHLRSPIRWTWSLNGSRLEGEGILSLARGVLRYRAEGERLTLTSTLGTWLNEQLCVEAVDAGGTRLLACRLLRASGERIDLARDPLLTAVESAELLAAGRVGLIPEPPGDPWAVLISDPAFIASRRLIDADAVARGLGMDPTEVRKLVEI